MHTLKHPGILVLAMAGTLLSPIAHADGASPVGVWKNIDDVSGKPRSLIRITESNGTLQGKIEKIFLAPNEDQNPKCEKCDGALKGMPVIGMVILTGLKKDGDEYVGGKILDPDSGNTYQSKAQLINDGSKLKVRGYVGVPMLGRSQTWERQE